MNNCINLEKVFIYLDGELDGKEAADVREHLRECSCCRDFMINWKEMKSGYSELGKEEYSDSFTESVLGRVTSPSTDSAPEGFWSFLSMWRFELAGAALAVMLLFSPLSRQVTDIETDLLFAGEQTAYYTLISDSDYSVEELILQDMEAL